MVTAVVIPIIIFYFFIISKRELQRFTEKWLALEDVFEEAIVVGRIQQINERRERFYYHRYIHILELSLVNKQTVTTVTRVTPIIKGKELSHDFQVGQEVCVYGNWKEDQFRFKRYEKL